MNASADPTCCSLSAWAGDCTLNPEVARPEETASMLRDQKPVRAAPVRRRASIELYRKRAHTGRVWPASQAGQDFSLEVSHALRGRIHACWAAADGRSARSRGANAIRASGSCALPRRRWRAPANGLTSLTRRAGGSNRPNATQLCGEL